MAKRVKESNELSMKLETYIEEMEELDAKVVSYEEENKELRHRLERMDHMEMVGSAVNRIEELETQKEALKLKLRKEIVKRENVETELFNIEEEFEEYKIQLEEEEKEYELEEHRLSLKSEEDIINTEKDIKNSARRKSIQIENLVGEKMELKRKIESLQQVSCSNPAGTSWSNDVETTLYKRHIR